MPTTTVILNHVHKLLKQKSVQATYDIEKNKLLILERGIEGYIYLYMRQREKRRTLSPRRWCGGLVDIVGFPSKSASL